jgi:hypothetical protein
VRPEPAPAAAPAIPTARLSIARRPLLDLSMAVSAGTAPTSAAASSPGAPGSTTSGGTPDLDARRPADKATLAMDPDFDLSSTFDVPAFLRRQEG